LLKKLDARLRGHDGKNSPTAQSVIGFKPFDDLTIQLLDHLTKS
jgi:hypothetical protein